MKRNREGLIYAIKLLKQKIYKNESTYNFCLGLIDGFFICGGITTNQSNRLEKVLYKWFKEGID